MIQLVAFLGNPGTQYAKTRHNLGRMVLEAMPECTSLSWRQKFHSDTATLHIAGRQVSLLVPSVYMNESGKSVAAAARFLKLPANELLVVHDELELPFGTVDLRRGGGYGGNNGLKSVGQTLGSADFFRLRCGIGRPERGSVSSYVLGKFSPEQEAERSRYCDKLAQIVYRALEEEPARLAEAITKERLVGE